MDPEVSLPSRFVPRKPSRAWPRSGSLRPHRRAVVVRREGSIFFSNAGDTAMKHDDPRVLPYDVEPARSFLFTVRWLCPGCGHEQTRGYDKQPRSPAHYEGADQVHRAMICKGSCRRDPTTPPERLAVALRKKEEATGLSLLPAHVHVGAADGKVPATTLHVMRSVIYHKEEKRRREDARTSRT